jgi:ABC-type lipoprotein release transport system permease subunit
MLRRNPTRIEVKLDDLEEFNQMKKDKELEQAKQTLGSNDWHTPTQDSLMDTRINQIQLYKKGHSTKLT